MMDFGEFKIKRLISGVVAVALAVTCVLTVIGLFHSGLAGLLHLKYNWDYCRYFNMIWNCACGRWFQMFDGTSYLLTHFSFSLALLAPILRVFSHPYTLSILQGIIIVAGGGVLVLTSRRHGMSWVFSLAVMLFYLGYHFTQYTQADEFHGVAVYMLLIPWIYHCLCYRRGWLWLPFVLMLGLREDAGLMVLPLLLYFAVKERWRPGYWYAGVAAGYSALALVVLYKLLMVHDPNAHNLTFVHAPTMIESLFGDGLPLRLKAMGWVLLPTLPFLWRAWRPVLIIPAVAILVTMLSAQWRQYYLLFHYGAVVMACLGVAFLEAARQDAAASAPDRRRRWVWAIIPFYLVLATVCSNIVKGYLPGTRYEKSDDYTHLDPIGQHVVQLVRTQLPATGLLLTTEEWSGFVADRRELVTPHIIDDTRHKPDLVLGTPQDLCNFRYLPKIETGEFGVIASDCLVALIQRGYSTNLNARLLHMMSKPHVVFAMTRKHAGETICEQRIGAVRYWSGNARLAPVTLSYGSAEELPAGKWVATFHFRTARPKVVRRNSWGRLSLHQLNVLPSIAEAQVPPSDSTDYRTQNIPFELSAKTLVEPRVTGEDAALWSDRVDFHPAN